MSDAKGLRLEWVEPASLTPNAKNWRRHPQAQRDALEGVLSDVGWAGAALYNERTGRLVDGHLRLDVALRRGDEAIPVLIGSWSEAQEAEILATLDPIAAMATTDAAALDALLDEVNTGSAAVMDMLAGLAEEAGLYAEPVTGAGGDDFDTTPDESGPTRTQSGDLWQLGRHRLIVGDSTDAATVARLMDGERACFLVADPPYGISAASSYADGTVHKGMVAPRGKHKDFDGDHDTTVARRGVAFYLAAMPKTKQVWWGANHYSDALPASSCWIVWDKVNPGVAFADGELAWSNQELAVRIFRHQWMGIYKDSERGEKRQHPTQKPIELYSWLYEKYADAGGVVLDPFAGVGASLIAAERTGRSARLVELSPRYADIILRRWEAETGGEAVLLERAAQASGQSDGIKAHG